ncbi:MAG TPA: hypothetical protein EYP85_02135 [Armatimonadetes bacterium]|nr:hypothetical protein [Armatimonadota bacterium]
MEVLYGNITDRTLEMEFSSADFSVASVLAAIREHLDMLEEMQVVFLGAATEVPVGPTPVFRPVPIKAVFEYLGSGDARAALERTYQVVWRGIVNTFPLEEDWAAAKRDFAEFVLAQADLLRARIEGTREVE